jgi:hypothetical protein
MGPIFCNDSIFASIVSAEHIPTDFWRPLQILRRTCPRSKEIGVGQILGLFLAYSVDIARASFGMERLVVHTEVEIPVVEIPVIGRVHGPMDFLTCPASGHLPMDKLNPLTGKN